MQEEISNLKVLIAYVQRAAGDVRWPYQILMEESGQSEEVCNAACKRVASSGLIDYCFRLRSGWLTPEGEAYLNAE